MINRDAIKLVLILWMTIIVIAAQAQNIGINATGSTPNTSAGLDVDFANKGMLVPRVTLTGTGDVATIATPAVSLLVYNTATAGVSPNNVTPGFYYWSGTAWMRLATGSGSSTNWTTTGNGGTDDFNDFIGTTDLQDLVFKTNGSEEMRLKIDGRLGLNTSNPQDLFHIGGIGNMLLDNNVMIQSKFTIGSPFNLLGYDIASSGEILLGDFTEYAEKMTFRIPKGDVVDIEDGKIEIRNENGIEPLMHFNENGRVGLNRMNPQDLFHIGGGDGNMLLDHNVMIQSKFTIGSPFNLLGYDFDVSNEILLGDFTESTPKMTFRIPKGDVMDIEDGKIEIRNENGIEPVMHFNENGRVGLNIMNPQDLFHIGGGDGNMLLDANVMIKSKNNFGSPFNLIGFENSLYPNIFIGEFSEYVAKMTLRIPKNDIMNASDGSLEILNETGVEPVMYFNENGNVGVNTDTPLEKFHINGRLRIGTYTFPDFDGASGQILVTDGSGLLSWMTVSGAINWGVSGNAGTNGTNFIGTTDAVDLITRTNNIERTRLTSAGNFGIGDGSPLALFTVGSGDLFQVVSTGHMRTINGTAALPSHSFVNDTDNGMYLSTTNELSFSTAATQRSVITAAGNFGIGDATPTALFTVGAGDLFQINTTGHTRTINGTAALPAYSFTGDNDNGMYLSNVNELSFSVGGTRRATINTFGNMGVGTAAPLTTIHADGEILSAPATVTVAPATGSGNITVAGAASSFNFWNRTVTDLSTGAVAGNRWVWYAAGGTARLYTGTTGDVLAMTSNGNVGVGTAPAVKFQVGTSGDGTVARANAWNVFSDVRLKKDFSSIDSPLEKINNMHGYYYYWISGNDTSRQLGYIAQEIETILPELVETDENGIKSVDYAKVTPVLVEAMKEQQTQIEDLKLQYDTLLKEVQAMKITMSNSTTEAKK